MKKDEKNDESGEMERNPKRKQKNTARRCVTVQSKRVSGLHYLV